MLHQGGCIHQDVAVTKVQAERLTSDSTGMEDGGGLSGAMMIKIQVDYRSVVSKIQLAIEIIIVLLL